MDIYETKYIDELYNRFENGGKLWIIERTDTNQYLSKSYDQRHHNNPFGITEWTNTITFWNVSSAFLNKKDAKNHMNFTEGGCQSCGNNSTQIPVIISEHMFCE